MTWTRAEDDDLGAIFEAVARPWPAALARLWLRHAEGAATYSRPYWLPKDSAAQIVASMQRRDPPGRRALAHVAGWGEKQARTVLELGTWRDPFATPAIEGPALGQPGARVGSRAGPGLGDKSQGSTNTEGPALGQPGARVGSRVGPDRARVSLDPNKNPQPDPEEKAPDLVPSPPPAEPSGSPADLWLRAADLADPEAWRASEEFQPSTNAYVFDDAEPGGVIEEPSDPRQIESPDHDSFDPASMVLPRTVGANPQRYTLHAVKADAKATPDVASTSPAQPFDPIEEFTPSPPPSASPAARPRGLSGEGAPEPASVPQSAPSLFGRADTAPEAQTPAKAPPRARKATAADKAADALAVYGAWRAYHPRAAETPTPGTLRTLGSLLTEAGSREDALLLIEWAHVGTCERARQIQGVAPWPDRRLKALWDLESLSRHVAGRLEMARSWKEGSTDKDSGLNVINLPPPAYRGPPNRTTRDIDFYKALELI